MRAGKFMRDGTKLTQMERKTKRVKQEDDAETLSVQK